MNNKKGQLGLSLVKAVFIAFLVLSVIGVATILAVNSLSDSLSSTQVVQGGTLTNESGYLNETGYVLSGSSGRDGFSGSIISVYNITGPLLLAGNYTLTGATLTNATTVTWADVNITYSYTYTVPSYVEGIAGNISNATSGFFGSTDTIYAILIVVVIMLAIAIIIGVVSRFGRNSEQF